MADDSMLEQALQPATLAMLPDTESVAAPSAAALLEDIDALHAEHAPRLFRFLLLQTRDRDLAHSLVQDTFFKLWRTRASFRGDCAVYTWITRIAISLLRSHVRTETFRFWKRASTTAVDVNEMSHMLRSSAATPERQLIAEADMRSLMEAVHSLTARQREVFLMRYVEEMELNEIATALNIPLPTIKTHLYRGLERVRTAMNPAPASTGAAR